MTVVAAVFLGIAAWSDTFLALPLVFLCALAMSAFRFLLQVVFFQSRPEERAWGTFWECLIVIGILYFLLSAWAVSEHGGRAAARRSECRNKLTSIALALHNYHEEYGCLPPPYLADEQGRPMHSWRVLILPYLNGWDLRSLYEQYDFSEPWNGPNNRRLAAGAVARYFQCSEEDTPGSQHTNYVAVVGPDTIWPEGGSVSLFDVPDGTSSTLLVVEVSGSGIHWMEPRDLDAGQLALGINPQQGQGISSLHRCCRRSHWAGVNAAMADGSVRFLPEDTAPKTLQAMATTGGGETIETCEPGN